MIPQFKASIEGTRDALGYTPADETVVAEHSSAITQLSGDVDTLSDMIAQNVAELPTASAENHLCLRAVNVSGTERLFINLLKGSAYQWFEFKLGSSSTDTAVLGTGVIGTLVLGKE